MRVSILLSLLLLVSACGAKRSSSYKMGETTRSDVVAKQGEPLSEVDIPVVNSRIMNYENNEKIQLKGDVVVNRFTNPVGDEKLLIWWKHQFKDCVTTLKTLPRPANSHTSPEMELSCRDQGLSVIYTQGSDAVSRVVEFEK